MGRDNLSWQHLLQLQQFHQQQAPQRCRGQHCCRRCRGFWLQWEAALLRQRPHRRQRKLALSAAHRFSRQGRRLLHQAAEAAAIDTP